jgi:hypothetical protein
MVDVTHIRKTRGAHGTEPVPSRVRSRSRRVRGLVTVGALAGGLLVGVAALPAAQAKVLGDWQAPVPVTAVNDPAATEGCPIEAPDASALYVVSTRSGGDQDIWLSARQDDGSFAAPQMLPAPVNSDANDFCPTPLRGKSLLFVSNRGGTDAYGTVACGGGDIYLTRLSPATGTWAPPRNLGCTSNGGPNGPGTEFGPSVVETAEGTLLYFSSGGALGSGTQDIYVSRQDSSGGFGARSVVTSLSSAADDVMPNVRKDGLEVVFASTRTGGKGMFDIWSATRPDTRSAWSTPTNVAVVNTAGSDTRPSLSWDGTRLYLGSSGDIYLSHR